MDPYCVRSFQVSQTFYITIKPVDDSLPLLQVPGMRVQEGVRKTITEFELKATDADTEVGHCMLFKSSFIFYSFFKDGLPKLLKLASVGERAESGKPQSFYCC